MLGGYRARLVRRPGWGPNAYVTRFERHETAHACTVPYRGVWERREWGKPIRYRACISVGARTIHLGTHADPITAAVAYDDAARRYHGAHAVLNFPEVSRDTGVPGNGSRIPGPESRAGAG